MEVKKRSASALLTITFAWVVLAFLLAPMLVTIPMSLTPERYISMPVHELSFRHYGTLVSDPVWLGAIRDSMIVGLGAMVVAVLIGSSIAIGLWQLGSRTARYLGVLPMLPLIVPPIVSALALSRAAVWMGMMDTYAALIVSHAIVGVPFVFMTVTGALENVDPRTLQAARSLGAGPIRSVLDIVVPNIKSGLLTGAVFAFFSSWDEIVIAIFVTSRNVFTLPRKIWSDLRDNIDPAVAAISAVMICVTLFIAIVYLIIGTVRAKRSAV